MRRLFSLSLILLCSLTAAAQADKPILISQSDSTRAIAFETPTFRTEPFSLDSPIPWNADRRTRVVLFTMNLALAPGEGPSAITADAEDAQHRVYSLGVEYFGPVPGQEWLSAVVLRLSDDLTEVGDVLVRVTYRGLASNRVRIGIGSVGGGPADDPGSTPTTVPPYVISGRVTAKGTGLSDVLLTLDGAQTGTARTDGNGAYSFTVNKFGGYTLTPSLPFYSFTPQSVTLDFLTGNRRLDFTGVANFVLSGRLTDDKGNGLASVTVTVAGAEDGVFQTSADGTFSFTVHSPGDYTITPASNAILAFSPQSVTNLSSDRQLNFQATRRTYSIVGKLRDVDSSGIANVPVTLSGESAATVTTDAQGFYSFTNIKAGFDYTVTPADSAVLDFSPQAVPNLTSDLPLDFQAERRTYSVNGRISEVNSSPAAGMPVTLSDNSTAQTVTTDAQGFYSFQGVKAGYDYTLSTTSKIFTFSPKSFSNLDADRQLDFQAARRVYTISGQLLDADSSPITDFPVKLSGNSLTLTTTTNYQGVFVFTNVEAGHDYGISAAYDNVFSFIQGADNLSSDLQLEIRPERRTFAITGRILEGAKPVAGATVSLNGWASATATTDATGFYSFPGLQAGRSYVVTVAKTYFNFAPQFRSLDSLENNRAFDFQGTPTYRLTGRVVDEKGAGIQDATVTLTGTESAVTLTASDGTYSFTVHSTGDYTLTASADQNFFTFSPVAQSLTAVSSDRTANFAGTPSLATDPSYVLEFDGTPKTVDCGLFWPDDRPLGHFFWEVWAAPGQDSSARYMISDGAGGIHAILFGFGDYGGIDAGRYMLLGNFWTGVGDTSVYYGGDDGPAIGEWGHLAVGWDGQQIVTYFNGVPVGRSPYSGQRWRIAQGGGGGRLFIGGSDHNNLKGRIAQVRGFEETNPREATSATAAFAPEILFSRGGSYLGYFFRPSQSVADMSNYYQGKAHRGQVRGVIGGVFNECPTCPLPQFVVDPAAPKFSEAAPVNNSAPAVSPSSPPSGALVFDSFSRANSTYTLGRGGLGSTEIGSAGPQQWQTIQEAGLEPFGILNGRAVVLANGPALAWVQTGSATGDLEVSVERHWGVWGSGFDTGVAFRVRDSQHFFFAYTSADDNNTAQERKLTVGYFLNGVRTDLATNISVPGLWTRLRVITKSDGQLTVLTNQQTAYSVNTLILADATGAGLFNSGPGRGLVNRWDNFVALTAP